jgi:hypothetical protein
MVIAVSNPSKSVWTAEIVLQSIGLSPLLFEVSLVLLRRYVMVVSKLKMPQVLTSGKRTGWTKRSRKDKVPKAVAIPASRLPLPSHSLSRVCRGWRDNEYFRL